MNLSDQPSLEKAARLIARAEALVVTAGAGMGVDSGLPDFRGPEGFWRAYPAFKTLGLDFQDLANPRWFRQDPHLAWGFYGHRLELYRRTVPHDGFTVLRGWSERMQHGAFVFTSNVDGQFQRAGFDPDRIVECHGSIHQAQCLDSCGVGIFGADGFRVEVNSKTFRAENPLPRCPKCGGLARPNILMFGDGDWDEQRTERQFEALTRWKRECDARRARVVVVECGAGLPIPTVRRFSEQAAPDGSLIRINLRDPEGPKGHLGFARGAAEALLAIDAKLATGG